MKVKIKVEIVPDEGFNFDFHASDRKDMETKLHAICNLVESIKTGEDAGLPGMDIARRAIKERIGRRLC